MGPGRISHPFHVLSLQHAFKFVCDVIFQTIFFSKGVVLPSLDALPLLHPRRGSLPGQQMAQLAQRFYVWWQFLFGVWSISFLFFAFYSCVQSEFGQEAGEAPLMDASKQEKSVGPLSEKPCYLG